MSCWCPKQKKTLTGKLLDWCFPLNSKALLSLRAPIHTPKPHFPIQVTLPGYFSQRNAYPCQTKFKYSNLAFTMNLPFLGLFNTMTYLVVWGNWYLEDFWCCKVKTFTMQHFQSLCFSPPFCLMFWAKVSQYAACLRHLLMSPLR